MMGFAPANAGFVFALLYTLVVWMFAFFLLRPGPGANHYFSLAWTLVYGFTLCSMLASYILGFCYLEYVARFTFEGHVVEWTTFWVAIAAAVSAGIALCRSIGRQVNVLALCLLFLGIFIAGEEIAWGQHVQAVELTPSEFFQTYNKQNEITMHNLDVGIPYSHWFQAVLPLLLLIGFNLAQYHSRLVAQYSGFDFHPRVLVFSVLFGLYFFHSSLPYQVDVLDQGINVTWKQLLPTVLISHSSSQSEMSECLFVGVLLIAAVALVFVQARTSEQDEKISK